MSLLNTIRAALHRRRHEREMQEEMADHLERSTARLVARGMDPQSARRAAEREFGNVPFLQDQARDARGTGWLDALLSDLRYAFRQYAHRPGTTLVMFIVLVVGISLTTLLFSFVHSYATQPPPGIERAADLVRIRGSQSAGADGRAQRALSEAELDAVMALRSQFARVAGWTQASAVLDAGPQPEQRGLEARITFVTADYFDVLGVRPRYGPGLATSSGSDPSLAATAVISHAMWDRLFSRDPGTVGATVQLNGVAVTVVGVAPERFIGVAGWGDYRVWMPLSARDVLTSYPPSQFSAVARLQPGVTMAQATAAVQVVATSHAAQPSSPDADAIMDASTEVVPLRSGSGDPMFERDVKLMTAAVGLLALLVLLITCANVSALLTGVATARRHEIAIRLSLGAARPRLIRQLLTESALLAGLAGAAALTLSWAVLRLVVGMIPNLPVDARLTWPAVAFTFGVALAVGVIFGLSPALHATRLAVATVLRDASANLVTTRARLQRALVAAQIALMQPLTVLLAAVLLLILGEYQPAPPPPYADETVIIDLRVVAPAGQRAASMAELQQQTGTAANTLVERMRDVPGVVSAVPTWGGARKAGYTLSDDDAPADIARDVVILSLQPMHPDYVATAGLPVVRGRALTPEDMVAAGSTAPVPAIIDVALARELWGDADPVGRLLQPASDTAASWPALRVVGVVDDPQARRAVAGIDHFVQVPPAAGQPPNGVRLRTAGPAASLLPALRELARTDAPGLSLSIRTLSEIRDGHERHFRMATTGVSVAGLAALLLAAIGLYAVMAFSVGQRTREIAVRLAIGGARPQIVRRFILDGLRLAAVGLLLGLPVSLLALRVLMSVPDVPQIPLPRVTVIAALSVVAVAALAAWLPARRAAGVDPGVALRAE